MSTKTKKLVESLKKLRGEICYCLEVFPCPYCVAINQAIKYIEGINGEEEFNHE